MPSFFIMKVPLNLRFDVSLKTVVFLLQHDKKEKFKITMDSIMNHDSFEFVNY